MVDFAKPALPLGRVTITPQVVALWGDMETAAPIVSREILDRFVAWDWGDVTPEDAKANDDDARSGDGRIIAAYEVTTGNGSTVRIWAVWYPDENPDGSGPLTCVLLPHQY